MKPEVGWFLAQSKSRTNMNSAANATTSYYHLLPALRLHKMNTPGRPSKTSGSPLFFQVSKGVTFQHTDTKQDVPISDPPGLSHPFPPPPRCSRVTPGPLERTRPSDRTAKDRHRASTTRHATSRVGSRRRVHGTSPQTLHGTDIYADQARGGLGVN